jgi:hypothetical protein
MAYFTGARGNLPPRFASQLRLRVDNGGTYLGSLYTLIQSRYPSYTAPTSSGQTAATSLLTAAGTLPKVATSFIQPTAAIPSPAPLPSGASSSFSPTQPAPSPLPIPGGVYSAGGVTRFDPSSPPPVLQPYTPPDPGSIAQAAAPIVGAIDPAVGAAAALIPAFQQAANAPDTTQVRFSNDPAMPDVSLPEVYNEDGTPVTPAAHVATFADKIKTLPAPAKIGGAVLLYLFLSRR